MSESGSLSMKERSHSSSPSSISKEQDEERAPPTNAGKEDAAQEDAPPARTIHGIQWTIVVISILSSTFLYALDNTIVANIRPSIIHSLGHIDKLPWVSVAYAVGETGANPFWGRNYGRFDSKWLFIGSVTIFEVGSAVSGGAPNISAFIVGRTIAGLGGSGIYVGTMNILSRLTTLAERPLYLALVGAAWSLGTVLGPIIGGAFADSSATWRWAFYFNICVAGAAAPAYFLLLPSVPSLEPTSLATRIARVDYLGTLLFIGAWVSLIMAIDFGGVVYSWGSGQIIALFVVTAVLWPAWILQQAFSVFTSPFDRTFPIHYAKSFQMALLFAQTSVAIACIVLPIYFLPLHFQFVRGDSALRAGVLMLPFIFATVLGAMVNGALFAKFSFYMPWFLWAGGLIMIGGGLLTTISAGIETAKICGYGVLVGFGAGLTVQAGYTVAGSKVPLEKVSEATAFVSLGQMGGLALSIAIGSSVLVNEAYGRIARILPDEPRQVVQGAVEGAGAGFLKTVSSAKREDVLQAVAGTIGNVMWMVVAAGALAVVSALFLKRERLALG